MVTPRPRKRRFEESCWYCSGTGQTLYVTRNDTMRPFACPRCDGTGKLPALIEPTLPGERL